MITAALKTTAFGGVVASLVLAGCSSTTSGRPASAPASPSIPPQTASTAPSDAPSTSPTAAPAARDAASHPVSVNKTMVDTALASSVTVTSELRHLPGPNDRQEIVALKLTIKNGTRYTSGISTLALQLTAADGSTGPPMPDDPSYAALLVDHGLRPVLADDPRPGQAGTGWVPFLFITTDHAEHLAMQYRRDKIHVLDSATTVPAKTYTVTLPA